MKHLKVLTSVLAAALVLASCGQTGQNGGKKGGMGGGRPPMGGGMSHGSYGDAGAFDPNPQVTPQAPVEAEPEVELASCVTVNLPDQSISDDNLVKVSLGKEDKSTTIRIEPKLKDMCVRLTGAWNGKVKFIDDVSKDLTVVLDNVTITSNDGVSSELNFNLKKKDKRVVNLVLVGANSITGAANSNSNKVLNSDSSLNILGTGSLDVNAHYKIGIAVDDALKIYNGTVRVNLSRGEDVVWDLKKKKQTPDYEKGFAVKVLHAFEMVGGALVINAVDAKRIEGYEARGLKVDGEEGNYGAGKGYIDIKGGDIIIQSDAKAMSAGWKLSEDAKTETTTDDPVPDVRISGGNIRITTFDVSRDSMMPPPEMQESMSAEELAQMKEQAAQVLTLSPEGIEAKNAINISGGTIVVRAMDDAIQAGSLITISGGKIAAYSAGNDSIDSNGTIEISGGFTATMGASEPEGGLDADFSDRVSYSGGTLIAIGGANNAPGVVTGAASFVQIENENDRKGMPKPDDMMSEDEALFDEELEEIQKQKEEMQKQMEERKNRKSDYAGKTIALTAKGSNDVIAALKVPEYYKGGSNVLILSDKITKDADYTFYKDASLTLGQGATWFGGSLDVILDGSATVTGSNTAELKGGKATASHMGGPGGRNSSSCSCGGMRNGGGPRGGQPPMGGGQPPMGGGQPPMGGGQPAK